MGIEQKGYIDAATSQLMRQTAYNDMNKEYGISLIKQGVVVNKFAAAAAVFARLYLSTLQKSFDERISSDNWFEAGMEAMRLAGAADDECLLVFTELLKTIEESERAADDTYFERAADDTYFFGSDRPDLKIKR